MFPKVFGVSPQSKAKQTKYWNSNRFKEYYDTYVHLAYHKDSDNFQPKKKKKNKTLTFALLTPKFSTESFDKTAFFTTHFALQNHGTASLNYCDLLTGSRKMKDSHQDKENK